MNASVPLQILAHVPRWVFVLFFALLALGVQQMFTRVATLRRVSVLPVAMAALSLYGVASAFGQAASLVVWALLALATARLVMARPLAAGVRYDASQRVFTLPGSIVPLALMMGVFFTKFAVGFTLALAPQMASQIAFAAPVCALYGVFTGLFFGRAARLWKLAASQAPTLHAVAL